MRVSFPHPRTAGFAVTIGIAIVLLLLKGNLPRSPALTRQSEVIALSEPVADGAVRLHRTLGLWNLIIIGMVIIRPTAPMGIYGVISNKAHGHVVTTILIAMVAMLFTAISYGRMARVPAPARRTPM